MKVKEKYRNRNAKAPAGKSPRYSPERKRQLASQEEKDKRVENTRERRRFIKLGLKKTGDGKDVSHTKSGGVVLEDQHLNRKRNGSNNKSTLKAGGGFYRSPKSKSIRHLRNIIN